MKNSRGGSGTGNIIERSHTIFWSGGETKEAGVGFAINNKLVAHMANPIPINDRLMTLCVHNSTVVLI